MAGNGVPAYPGSTVADGALESSQCVRNRSCPGWVQSKGREEISIRWNL